MSGGLNIPQIAITAEPNEWTNNLADSFTDVEDLEETKSNPIKSKLRIKVSDDGGTTDLEDLETSDSDNEVKIQTVSFDNLQLDTYNSDETCAGLFGTRSQSFKVKGQNLSSLVPDEGLTDAENFATDEEPEFEEIPDSDVNFDEYHSEYVNICNDLKVQTLLELPVLEPKQLTDVESVASDSDQDCPVKKIKPKKRRSQKPRRPKITKSLSHPVCLNQLESDEEADDKKFLEVPKKEVNILTDTEEIEDEYTNKHGSDTDVEFLEGAEDKLEVPEIVLPFPVRTLILLHENKSLVPTTKILPLDETSYADLADEAQTSGTTDTEVFTDDDLLSVETYQRGPTPDVCGYESSSICYGEAQLSVSNDSAEPLTDTEDLAVSVRPKRLKKTLQVEAKTTDTEDFYMSDGSKSPLKKQKVVYPDEDSFAPYYMKERDGTVISWKDSDGTATTRNRLNVTELKLLTTPDLTDVEDLVASADEEARSGTSSPNEFSLDPSSSKVHIESTKKLNLDSPTEIMYLKGGSYRQTYTDVEEMSDDAEWDVSKKSAPQEEAVAQGAEQQGLSTTTERLVASNEETLLDKPLGQQLTGFSVIDDLVDLKTVCEQTNAFIQSESQPEPYDALADKYTRKEPINDKKVDDNKNNMNEKKKAKKGFFGSIKTFVERSFESDSESEKSPKKSKKPKKEKKKKIKEEGLPPRKPKLPTPPLEPSDIDSIPFAEASVSDIPPPYKPPEVPIPVTDLDADLELKPEEKQREKTPVPKEKEPEKSPKVKAKDKKKAKAKTIVVEEVTKTIEPFVIEAEEFSIIVDPTKKESPKKSKETFTINIDESFDKIEKKILEKKPILTEEKIVKPLAALEMKSEAPVRPPRTKDHVYEDIEEPAVTIPQDRIKDITTDLIQNEINFGGWSDAPAVQKEDEAQKEIVEKQDKEVLKEKDGEGKKKEEKKGGFFGLFKKKDSKKEEEPLIEKVEKEEKEPLSEAVLKDIADSNRFLLDEVQNYHDVRPVSEVVTTVKPEIEEAKAQSESFFGLFKKPKVPSEKKTEAPEKKARKSEEKKAAVVLSEEVLKNILDSKRFLEGEVQNYDDVIAFESTREEEKVVESPPPKKIVTPSPKKKTDEPSPKKKAEEKREPSPKKTLEDRRESSPKSSPGFFGLFKKPKKDDAEESKVELSEEVVKDMKETDQFLVAEIEHYHDVKPLVEETKVEESVEVVKVVPDAAEVESGGFFGLFKKPKKEEEKKDKEKKVEKKEEEKKVEKKEEEKKDEKILQLSETTLKDMAETNQFLSDEVQNYHDVKALVEEKKEETAEAVKVGAETAEVESGGFFGLFKKTKKEDEKKEEKKKEEKKDEKTPLSETTLRDMADTDQFLSDEVQNYHDVRPATEELIEEEKVTESAEQPSSGFFGLFKKTKKEDEKIVPEVPKEAEVITIEEKPEKLVKVEEEKVRKVVEEVRESSPRPTSGFFGLFKKSKKDEEETVPAQPPLSDSVVKDMDDTNQFLSREIENFEDVKPAKFEAIQEEKVFKVVDKTVESSPKSSRGLYGLFKSKSKKEEEEPPEPKVVSEIVVKEMEETTQFLIDEVENYHDVKPEEEKPSKVVEEEVESSPKSSRGLFGIFKKSKKEEEAPEAKPVISEAALQAINDTSVFLTDEIDNYQDVKPAKFEAIEEEKVSKVAEETVEASPKSSRGLFGMFKKSKKDQDDVEPKTAISESVEKDIVESETLLTVEVGQYDDTKPVEEEKKKVEEIVDSKPSKGLFGIFKKSKKEEEETTDAKPVISEAVVKEMDETHQFLTGEVENYHDAKPEEKEEKVVRIVEEGIEASPKSGRGIFGILKKAKKEEEKPIVILSEQVLKDMVDTDQFLIDEVENYHDVKVIPEEKVDEKREASPRPTSGLFGIFKKSKKEEVEIAVSEAVQKDVEDTKEFLVGEVEKYDDAKLVDETREASPRPTSGLFGLFKKSKKEEIEVAPISDLVQKDVEDAKEFLVEEFEKLEDSKPVVVEETREASPRPTSGLFGIFKKSSKKEDIEVPPVSEAAQKEVEDTKEFLVGEVEKYEDAKPVDETREASPRPTSGLFGIFKKSKKEEIEVPPVSETVQKEMEVTKEFLVSEVEKYEDVKPVVVEETKPASGLFGMFKKSKKEEIEVSDVKAQLSEAVEDTTEILVEEVDGTREASPRPTSGLFGIFKKSKKEEVEVLEIKAPVAEAVQKDIDDTKDFLVGEVEKFEDVKLVVLEEEVKLTTPDIEAKPEVKGGFLSKFKKTKKKPSLAEAQLSEETQKSMDETKNFLSTELANYEDGEVEITDKKEEKTVTFDGTKSQMVLEAHLPQPEVPQVVDVVKTEIADLEKETKEELIEVQDVVLQEAKEAQQIIEEIKPSKKDKQSKDKKGFFNIFGKKSKSQEASFDEARGRPEEQSEGSPKKQKRRKSSSPFKFFDKMKKSEEEVKEEAEILAPPPIEDVSTEEAKDDLLAVEFEDQPAMDLSEEVLGSLDKKMEQLKHKYTPETQKQINDCRDFLFIEVDNYEDAKPVVVTDIDTGLSTDAGKAVDDIIGKASKVVEDTQKQVEVEVDRKGAKKGDRKSGFFSKLGNLISGSADEAKSELKEAKKSAADKAKDAADSAAKSVEDGAKKSKEKLKETQKAASDKAAETKDAAKEFKETVVKGTGEKIDEAKQGVLSLKESLMEIKAKTGGKIDDLKKDAADQAQAASETVVEVKDAAIRKADGVKDSVETTKADIQKSGQEVVDDAAKKVEDVKATVDETKTDLQKSVQELLDAASEKAEDSVKTSVDAAGKRIDGVKAAVDETKAGVQKSGQEFVDIASKKTEDVKDSVKASVDAAGTKIDGVKATVDETKTDIQKSGQELLDAAGKKAEDVKAGVKAAVDEADKKVDGVKVTIDDTKTDIQKSGQELVATADRKTHDVKDGVKATVDATGKKIEHAKDDVKATVDDTKADLQKSGQELLDTAGRKTQDVKDGVKATVDATGKKIEAVKDDVKATADDTKADLQKSGQEILDAAAKKTEDVKSSVKATVHAADKKVDSVKATIDDTKTGIQKSAQQFVDSAGKKSADVKDSVKASVDAAGKKAEDVKDSVKASVDAVGKKAEDVKDSAKASVDTAGKKIEGVKATVVETKTDIQKSGQEFLDSASKKLDAVKQTTEETKIKTQEAAKSVADVTAKKIDDVKKGAADVIAQKAEDVDKARKVVVDSTSQKVEDVKLAAEKGKEIATETLEKIGDETKPRIEEVGKAKDETVDKAAKKLEEAKKDTQIITQKVASATDKAKTQGADKVEEICKGAEGVVEHVQASAKAKGDKVIDAKDKAIEDLSKTKESAKAAAAQKIDDVSTTAAKAKDSVLGDFMKMKESVQESADHKVEEIKKAKDSVQSAIATKADELKKTKDGVQDTVAGKVDQAKITVSQKVEDVAQAKDAAGRKAEDFAKAAGQKIDDLAGAKDAATRKADDMSKAAAEDLTKTKQKTEDVLKAAKDTVQERASEKLDQVGKSVSEKADDFATSATKRVDQAKDAVATKIGGVTQVVSQKVEEIAKVKESAKDTASQKLDDLVQAKEDVKQIAAQKVEGVAADAAKARDEASKIATEIKDTTSQKVDHFAEMASQKAEDVTSQKVKEATHKVGDVLVQKVDDLGKIERGTEAKIVDELSKMKQGVGSDLSKTKEAGEKKVEDLSKTTAQKAAEVRDVASGFFSAFAEEKKKETDAKLIDLDDELAKLTSSLEQLSQPVKSYVTSPTSARRSESQRISREERPTVREVRSLPSEDSTEEHYTITEPEDTDEKRRKPLFHMESEDDDSADVSKSRDRRDSVRSNVLETLTEHKLDNLLSDLVQDLEKSVAEGKEQPLTQLSKAETELEAMTKDSQADVEQIEQKLRDLDKALDSLEQASDPKLEKKLHRVERKFERMASDVMEGVPGTSPTEVEARRENEFQKLVSQLSTEEVSDFQKEYSHLWDETTFSKSEEWDSKTPDSQLDVLELPQGEESSFAATGRQEESTLKAEGEEAATGGQQTDRTSAQQRPISDQHQLSEEMKQLLKELEKESKQ